MQGVADQGCACFREGTFLNRPKSLMSELSVSPSIDSSLHRGTPPQWRTTSRNPCSSCSSERATRRCALLPSVWARPQSLDTGAISASQSASPPWTIPLPTSLRFSPASVSEYDARPLHSGLTPFLPTPCPYLGNLRPPTGEKGAEDDRVRSPTLTWSRPGRAPW